MLDLLVRDGLIMMEADKHQGMQILQYQLDRIVEIGNLTDAQAVQVIDATGKVVFPYD